MPLGLLHLKPSGGFRPIHPMTAVAGGGAALIPPSSVELRVKNAASRRPFGRIEGQGPTASLAMGCQRERLPSSPGSARRAADGAQPFCALNDPKWQIPSSLVCGQFLGLDLLDHSEHSKPMPCLRPLSSKGRRTDVIPRHTGRRYPAHVDHIVSQQ
jgi:hypothetical protein